METTFFGFLIQAWVLSSEAAALPEWSSFISWKIVEIFRDVKSGSGSYRNDNYRKEGESAAQKNVQDKKQLV